MAALLFIYCLLFWHLLDMVFMAGLAVPSAAAPIISKAFDKALSDKYNAAITKIGRKSL